MLIQPPALRQSGLFLIPLQVLCQLVQRFGAHHRVAGELIAKLLQPVTRAFHHHAVMDLNRIVLGHANQPRSFRQPNGPHFRNQAAHDVHELRLGPPVGAGLS